MLRNIQILRGFAATLVVWTHLSEMSPSSPVFKYGPYGLEGVDLFFVISGFIMVHTTASATSSPLNFLFRRFARVAPLYYIATLCVILIYFILPTAFKSTAVDLPSLFQSILFIPYEKSDGRIYPLYYLGWTLNYEIFFYLLFAVSLGIYRKFRTYICSCAIVSLAAAGLFIHSDEYGVIAYAYTRPIMMDFVLGMLIAQSSNSIFIRTKGNTTLYFSLIAVGFILIFSLNKLLDAPYTLAPTTNTFLNQGIPAALIVLGAVLLEKAGRASGRNLFTAVGDSSYSLYLFHFFMVASLMKICDRFLIPESYRVIVALVALPLICLTSYLIYVALERPINKLFLRARPSKINNSGSLQEGLGSGPIN